MWVGEREIGDVHPCYIIAEIGVNHDGSVEKAKKLIDVASKAGVDAVKFQMFDADKLVIKSADKMEYQKIGVDETQYEMLKRLELSRDDFQELYSYATHKYLAFICSPFDNESVDFLDKLGVQAFKVPSGEINNFRLLERIAEKGRPTIISTGMSTMDEVLRAVIPFNGCDIALLHCVSEYPSTKKVNLRAMKTMREAFWLPVGFSDHTLGIEIPKLAVACGANIIEKHITLDKNDVGPDHKASLNPKELEQMVRSIKEAEKILGNGIKEPTAYESHMKNAIRRSIVASVNIPQGTRIANDMVEFKRPGMGIPPDMILNVVGKKSKVAIKKDDVIHWGMIR